MADNTIIATARKAECEGHRYNREENDPRQWLDVNANWRQRRLFDWAYIAFSMERKGFTDLLALAEAGREGSRVENYKEVL